MKEKIWPGELIQVLDFGQNYMNTYQDEPQPVHWDHRQTVIHNILNYYLNPEGKLITEKYIMLTADLKHDTFVVSAFEKATSDHLKKKGFVPEVIIQFCDNCSDQYKSKGSFQFISEAGIPTIHMYFRGHHEKGLADSAAGWIKSAATRAVKCCQAVFHNAREFFEFCQKKLKHNHYSPERNQEFIQEFFFFEEIA